MVPTVSLAMDPKFGMNRLTPSDTFYITKYLPFLTFLATQLKKVCLTLVLSFCNLRLVLFAPLYNYDNEMRTTRFFLTVTLSLVRVFRDTLTGRYKN